jgi:large subunit ribosomal protein L23
MSTTVLIRPMVTEKSQGLSQKLNTFCFEVNRKANKLEIKKAVEKLYGVNVESVSTAMLPGKARSRYTKTGSSRGQTSSYKKAYVKLAKGDSIDFYAQV